MKRLLLAITLSFFTILILLFVKNEYSKDLPDTEFGMTSLLKQKQIDYLFIGSSTFRKGLDIEVLQSLPGSTYILAYNGNQPVTILMELEYLLEHGLSIQHLYIDFYPYLSLGKPTLSDTRLLLDTDMPFKRKLYAFLHASDETFSFMDRISDFYEMFVSSNNSVILWWPIYQHFTRNRNYHGGTRNLRASHGKTAEELAQRKLPEIQDGLKEIHLQALGRIMEIAKTHHIELTFLEIPKYEKLSQSADYIETSRQMMDYLISQDANIAVLRADDFEFDLHEPDHFSDLIHLSGSGAYAYTTLLLEHVRQD